MVLKRWIALAMLLALGLGRAQTAEAPDARHEGKGDVDERYVRLHVIADSDDDAAQALKLTVRDACLSGARAFLEDCGDAEEAWTRVNDNLDALERTAREAARAGGWEGKVAAETGVYAFPECRYGDVTVPAGEYRALRVVIGRGEGHNWWCVLFPSLCVPGELTPGEPVVFYSSVWRWIRSWWGGDEA